MVTSVGPPSSVRRWQAVLASPFGEAKAKMVAKSRPHCWPRRVVYPRAGGEDEVEVNMAMIDAVGGCVESKILLLNDWTR